MLFGDMTATDARRELPLSARLLDALSGVFIVTLLCVLIFGPVRIDAVVANLSVSSLARLLALLAASVAVRHLAWPRPPFHLRFLAAARALAGSVALRRALPPFLATRGAVLFTGVLAVLTIGFPDGEPPVRISDSEVVNLPLRWDAGWYLDIAVHGYRWSPDAEGQQNVAFFPAYPALMSLGAALVNAGNEPEGLGARLSYERYYVWHLAAGLVVALAAFLWGLAYVYRLAREDLDDRSATSAVLLLCAFPFAVFYGAPYSESLFLLATVAAFFHARQSEWGVACVWGALAGLTRPNGFVLCIPLALLALRARARSPRAWLAVAAPLGGLAAFSLYLLAHTGNPLAWLDAHAAWGRSISATDMLLAFPLEFRSGEVLYNGTLGEPLRWLDGGAAILALALVVPLTRRLGWAYGSWIVVNLALAIGSGGLLSVGRVVSTLFPLFIYLGARLTLGQSVLALMVFALLQGPLRASVGAELRLVPPFAIGDEAAFVLRLQPDARHTIGQLIELCSGQGEARSDQAATRTSGEPPAPGALERVVNLGRNDDVLSERQGRRNGLLVFTEACDVQLDGLVHPSFGFFSGVARGDAARQVR